MASNSLYFFNFKTDKKYSTDEIVNRLLDSDNDDRFIINDTTDTIVDGYYITYVNTKELIFDEESELLESKVLKKNIIIPFLIDISREILDIWGKRNYISKLLIQLNILFNHEINIDPININLRNVVKRLDKSTIKIRTIKIDNYLLEKDIIANCIFDLKNHNNPCKVLKKYSENLVYITLSILNDLEDFFTIMIYKSGSVVVYKYREELSQDDIDIIREICLD
ncbi:hypothetical protein [Intestinibacter bartlettii]|uniref:hypothetical protein n=1 Tax=Intestinibacter bartlettii TaxID=261299 RepID=UPI001D110F47|nr:hypothetical protein [Intestinibacter bartlettii]MCC2707211.1 hypothetical protein [Intestinibacter bartlettii]MCC2762660.1 hypothetical protein [Intestinibacter bartlettii]MDU6474075.1 hypothetical protein [Intestinibacter bartlettii]